MLKYKKRKHTKTAVGKQLGVIKCKMYFKSKLLRRLFGKVSIIPKLLI